LAQVTQTAQLFLNDLNDTENLIYKETTGYWANTYIPGDPEIRALKARLSQWDRKRIAPIVGHNGEIESRANQNSLPFDPPSNAALAVYLQADKKAIQGPTRMRLQVGLQATERFSGQRPAMNVGIVVDVQGEKSNQLASKLKALLEALAKTKQPGDRFSLVIAGEDGGEWIPYDEFRHGPIQVAINKLFGKRKESRSYVDLIEAVELSTEIVQQHDDPSAVLGSSMIILISSADLTDSIDSLQAMAHQNALKGTTMSVFPLGETIDLSHVSRLVLSGQGQRRILTSVNEAENLVSKELLSSSRAVARAVRLRIRLAKGVKLVKVFDSYRLDEAKAEQVRQAEQSIDKRLSQNFGIQADRGEDEEGIQIVIPSFYAGDSHVVMLDIVVSKPGPIADVTVRYKDLLYLNNGVVRSNLNISRLGQYPGPLQYNVLKNMLAIKLSQSIRRASAYLSDDEVEQANAELIYMRDLFQGMRQQITAWSNDQELLNDELLLSQYIAILGSPNTPHDFSNIAASMRFAGYRKLFSNHK